MQRSSHQWKLAFVLCCLFPNFNENISLAKTFSFGEDLRLDFRWEVFNLFNRTVFGTGSTNLNSNTLAS